MTDEQRYVLIAQIHEAFTPTAPIKSRDLFAGRKLQVQKVLGAVFQRGEHAILYGERGVGKTSLVNTLFDLMVLMGKANYQTARVQCANGMKFESIWRGALRKLMTRDESGEEIELDHMLEGEVNSSAILHAFEFM